MGRKKKLPQGNYRAVEGDHVQTARENSTSNISARARWHGRLCYLCWEHGTVIVKGRLYCAQHAPKEGA